MNKSKRQSTIGGSAYSAPPMSEPVEMDVEDPNEEELNISDDEDGGTRIGDIFIPPPVKPYCSTESIGPRLIITKITNNNFKSYAGEIILGPFFHRFQAIIGPNGSGKSNVIDSMLFVFGYRANKIRCKKLSVLMHKSARYNNVCSCRVAVHFHQIIDKPDGTFEIVPNSDFFISRSAFADNSSFYTINDKKVHFKEVGKLLKSHNVDLDHNRFLILQGEVESIAMMKAKALTPHDCGLLEYLEDIIGTNRYKEPLEKINDRVDKLTEDRTDKHNRCRMAEFDMNELKHPMEEAVEYLELENELTRTINLNVQKYLSEQTKKLQTFQEEHEVKALEIKEHDEKFSEIKKTRLEKEKIIKEEIANYEKLLKKKEDYEQMLKSALIKFAEIQSSIEGTNKRRKTLMSQLKKEEDNLIELKKVPDKNAAEIEECKTKIERITAQKVKQEEKVQANWETVQQETKPLIEKKERLETELIDLQKEVNESKSALELAESELQICQQNETQERRKYEFMKISYEDAFDSFNDKKKQQEEFSAEIPAIQKEISEKQVQLRKNQDEEKELKKQVNAINADIEEKTRSAQQMRSNNAVLDALMKQKINGNLPGILGRLGDLGGIDSNYDVAISTCCGRLDNIVVDTVDTAQACIDFLRKNDVGRATFIALEKISHYGDQGAQRIQTPENVPRLFDLVRVEDQRVLAAFYFALRDTLVSKDLEQGTRVAYGAHRYRVVSLKGELIEMSGTMSGGGNTQIRGRMGTQVKTKTSVKQSANDSMSKSHLEDLRIKARELQDQVNYLQEQQGELERNLRDLQKSLKDKESSLKRISIDLNSLSQQLPLVEKQLNQQQQRMTNTLADPERVQELKSIINDKKVIYDKNQANAKKIIVQVEATKKKIESITGDKVKSVEKLIDDLTKQIAKLSKNISSLNVEITTSERNVKKTETKIESLKNEITLAQNSMKEASEERAKTDNDAIELKDRIKEASDQIDEAQKDSSSIRKEITQLQQQENDGNIIRVELDQNIQVLKKKINDVQVQLPHWQNKLQPLKLNKIPNQDDPKELKTYTEIELASYKLQDLQYRISVQEEKLKSKKPNLTAIDEYFKKREVYLERVQVLEDITKKRNEMRQLYDDVRKKRYTEFSQGFNIITKKLKEMYQMITQGGDAELELVDSMDPFSEGVSFSVRPPKKSWKNISNLSGGEKTLSSLALVFALHYYKPSPLYFMDEIDAALDFKNVSIVANYIKARTKNAQFIIISLRSNMFELADSLTGIYKVKDCTDSITIPNRVPKKMLALSATQPPAPSQPSSSQPTSSQPQAQQQQQQQQPQSSQQQAPSSSQINQEDQLENDSTTIDVAITLSDTQEEQSTGISFPSDLPISDQFDILKSKFGNAGGLQQKQTKEKTPDPQEDTNEVDVIMSENNEPSDNVVESQQQSSSSQIDEMDQSES